LWVLRLALRARSGFRLLAPGRRGDLTPAKRLNFRGACLQPLGHLSALRNNSILAGRPYKKDLRSAVERLTSQRLLLRHPNSRP